MSNQENTRVKTMRSVFVALFAAIISCGAFIAVPLGPIPVVLQNMFIVLAGLLLGGTQGGAAVGLFLLAGTLGLPVFAGGKGGFAHFAGPTGGFLIGYFFAALAGGFYTGRPSVAQKTPVHRIIAGTILAYAVIYLPGVPHFMNVTNKGFIESLYLSVIPFLPGDLIKLVITVPLAVLLRPVIARYISE